MTILLARSVVLVCFAVLSMRLMGKRQIGQLQPFELVIAIMIADLAATPMSSLDTPLLHGILPMLALVVLHQLFTLLSLKSQKMRAFLSGTPTVVIHNGKIDAKALQKLCFNLNDLLEEMRTGGILTPTEVGTAIMETSGKLSVFPISSRRPVNPQELGIETQLEGIPLTLVMDGRVEDANLTVGGMNREWLFENLKAMGFLQVKDVLLCYVDTDGQMTAHGYGDAPPARRKALSGEDVKW
ncbi:MAG: DUF421 domain-containing protein [Clostridiales bacterium]|nr:DUF421 domain-containing protein [Clostridiales bacterium]